VFYLNFGKDRWYNQMGQVGTGWSTWKRWDNDMGVSIIARLDRMGLGQGVLRLGGTGWDSG